MLTVRQGTFQPQEWLGHGRPSPFAKGSLKSEHALSNTLHMNHITSLSDSLCLPSGLSHVLVVCTCHNPAYICSNHRRRGERHPRQAKMQGSETVKHFLKSQAIVSEVV